MEESVKKTPETTIQEGTFKQNIIYPWLKSTITLTNKRLKWFDNNTVFGVIPFGKKEMMVPLSQVSSVMTSPKFHPGRFAIGLIFVLAGLQGLFSNPIAGLICILIGVPAFLNCYTALLKISNNSGQAIPVEVSILEKNSLQQFGNVVNETLIE